MSLSLTNNHISIPPTCSEWTILDDIDYDNITPQRLNTPVNVRVGRDYHSSSIVNKVSIFTAVPDIEAIQYIVTVAGYEFIANYKDCRADGNILHSVSLNPNHDVYNMILLCLGDDTIDILANMPDRNGFLPIEYIVNNRTMFLDLVNRTNIDERTWRRLVHSSSIASEYYFNLMNNE